MKRRRQRSIREARLPTYVQELLAEARHTLEPSGWTVRVVRNGTLAFVFSHPLSPLETSFGLSHDLNAVKDRRRFHHYLRDESEFVQLRKAPVPKRKNKLLRWVRGSAASYLWTDEVYQQVLDMLASARNISAEEWEWASAVGPLRYPEHVRRDLAQRLAKAQANRDAEMRPRDRKGTP